MMSAGEGAMIAGKAYCGTCDLYVRTLCPGNGQGTCDAAMKAATAQAGINAATHGSLPKAYDSITPNEWDALRAKQMAEPLTLPKDYKARKALPICTGVLDYFPLALAEIAKLSKIGNDKHNPGQPLHWSKGKSNDHADCLIRHQLQRGTIDEDTVTAEFPEGLLHDVAVAWRALAQLQIALEKLRA